MRIGRVPHAWAVSPKRAVTIQQQLAGRVSTAVPTKAINLVAGVDLAFSHDGRQCIAGVVLWDIRRKAVLEERIAVAPVTFPYVPGLLSFREGRAVIAVLRRLRIEPDAVICDGHGLAHPRRFGLACHIGVLVNRPTIGCAKSLLIGTFTGVGVSRGARSALGHEGERIGTVLRTRAAVKPVFISVGHQIDLLTAERIVLACGGGYRLPEPTRLADRLVTQAKRTSSA